MTVQELINQLSALSPDAQVWVNHEDAPRGVDHVEPSRHGYNEAVIGLTDD